MSSAGWFKETPTKISPGQSLFCFRPPGWKIIPHTHGLTQVLQTMVYFPSDGFSANQGTYLYRRPWYRKTPIDKQIREVVPFRASKRPTLAPFAHNALISWINTPRAIHGTVDRPGDPPRRYIFLAHVIDQAAFAQV
jgi:hypothetical protein